MKRFKLAILAAISIIIVGLIGATVADAMTPRLRDYRVCGLGLLMEAVSQGTWILTTNQPVPGNVTVVSQAIDQDGCVLVRLYDRSFDLVPDGQSPPLINWEWSGLQPPTVQYQAAYARGMAQVGVPVPQCPGRFYPYHPPYTPAPTATPRGGDPWKGK